MKQRHRQWTGKELLGKAFIDRQNQPVLTIGRDTWTREEMVTVLKCGNFNSASILTQAALALQVDSAEQMANRIGMDDLFSCNRVGVTTMYTWMCVLDRALKRDPLGWIRQGRPREAGEVHTLSTEKMHVAAANKAAAAEPKRTRKSSIKR